MLIAEFFFLFVILYIGSRFGGLGLGAISGLGLAIEVFILRMPPSSPPVDVMLIIIAVVVKMLSYLFYHIQFYSFLMV